MWRREHNDSALGSVYEFISKQTMQGHRNYQIITSLESNKEVISA